MLRVRGLCKSYGSIPALAGVDLDVGRGEIVGLLGPNGAGKTTLVSIVAGLRRADAGSVSVADVDALRFPQRAQRLIGLSPQDTAVYPTLTARENLRYFGELAGLRKRQLDDSIETVAHALQLVELLDRRVQTLSGGEKRRLHTAMALVHRPPLVLLDEPTTGADVRSRAELLRAVRELAASGSAVVYSTHYLHEIEQLGAAVSIIDHGQVIARGSVAELVATHATSLVEFTFAGTPPPLARPPIGGDVTIDGKVLRVRTQDPAEAAAATLTALGARADELRSLEIVHPSLEAVFLALTGRRYRQEDGSDREVDDVATP